MIKTRIELTLSAGRFQAALLAFLVTCSWSAVVAQRFETTEFVKGGLQQKLEIMAATPYDDLREAMPNVDDTLERLRREVYAAKGDDPLRFLLDQVDVNRCTDVHNDGAALYVLENALRFHVRSGYDSLYCFRMIRRVIASNNNDARLMQQYRAAAETWGPYFALETSEKLKGKKPPLIEGVNDRQRYTPFYIAAIIAVVAVVVVLLLFLRRYRKREKQLSLKNDQIQDQNKQIEQSLREKEALIREIHHRVKNNLQIINSMLNLQLGKLSDEKTENVFFEAKQRINAIALTHQMLYQKETLSNINLSEYIETLVRQIEATMSSPNIELQVMIVDQKSRLTIDGAVPLGLVINELLTNAYKHAFPKGRQGYIRVSLSEKPESFRVTVSDNGVGLPSGFRFAESTTLGMELVYILVEQLDSRLEVEQGEGTSFSFEISRAGAPA